MPFKTYNTKADYDSEYNVGAEGKWGHPGTRQEIRLHYSRIWMMPTIQARAQGIATAMGWVAPGPVLVVVGAGFAWLAEAFEGLGFTRVVGIDVSPYIQTDKTASVETDLDAAITAVGLNPASGEGLERKQMIMAEYNVTPGPKTRASRGCLNQTGSTQQSRNAVRSALGLSGNTQPDWLLTENVIERMTDAEVIADSTSLKAWVPNLAHYVQPVDINHPAGLDANGNDWNAKTLEQWKALLPLDTFIEQGTFRKL